jgi:NAD(P)-dependent dehydrogenase (short-subunit alcohol dehydrogenase family)
MADVNSMQGKRAIVTGGGTGLGAATALGLARRGVNVCINYNSSVDAASDVVTQCKALGVDAVATVNLTYTVGKTGGFAVAGMGSTTRYPVATAHLTVVDTNGQVIWEDYAAKGKVASTGLRTTMGADLVENETEVLSEAAASAFDAVIERYQAFEEKK